MLFMPIAANVPSTGETTRAATAIIMVFMSEEMIPEVNQTPDVEETSKIVKDEVDVAKEQIIEKT